MLTGAVKGEVVKVEPKVVEKPLPKVIVKAE
jgi:hypothetical protein